MRKFTVIFQPHRYSRTKLCWDEFVTSFSDCDHLIVTDVYAANEEEIVGISGDSLCTAILHPNKQHVGNFEEIAASVASKSQDGDIVLCLGAGSVGSLPPAILAALAQPIRGIAIATAGPQGELAEPMGPVAAGGPAVTPIITH